MTDSRPGAEFFGRAARAQSSSRNTTPPAGTGPQFGPPSGAHTSGAATAPPRTAAPPTTASPSASGGYTAGSVATSGSGGGSQGRPPSATTASPPLAEGVMARAKVDDPRALEILFAQFVPPGEQIVETRYMGVMGMWGIGTHSFAAVTTERVASLTVGLFGAVTYRDGSLEYINSSVIFQPSRLKLYLPAAAWVLVTFAAALYYTLELDGSVIVPLLVLPIALLLVPVVVKLTYRFVKSGLAIWIREGLCVLIFIDRRRITLANRLYRLCSELRDERIREIGHP
ncbi:hypothetical protein [Geodermatophilus sp. URMC 62]|uniref:hypothetical protein n=1 Tax=Geodermatophilus sp. URMC 62 TaxID=3423414 RepID=UPI00406C7E74